MRLRHDALAGAAEIILVLEALCRATDGRAVGTIGKIGAAPNASNVIAGRVEMVAEWRSVDPTILADLAHRLEAQIQEVAARRGLALHYTPLSDTEPVLVPRDVQQLLLATCQAHGVQAMTLPSGAGHDTNHLATLAPAGMVFIPSRGGRSHCPEEWSEMEAIVLGTRILGEALLAFDRAR